MSPEAKEKVVRAKRSIIKQVNLNTLIVALAALWLNHKSDAVQDKNDHVAITQDTVVDNQHQGRKMMKEIKFSVDSLGKQVTKLTEQNEVLIEQTTGQLQAVKDKNDVQDLTLKLHEYQINGLLSSNH